MRFMTEDVKQHLDNDEREPAANSHRALISDGRMFHQAEAKAKKALTLVEVKWISFRLRITSLIGLQGCAGYTGGDTVLKICQVPGHTGL